MRTPMGYVAGPLGVRTNNIGNSGNNNKKIVSKAKKILEMTM